MAVQASVFGERWWDSSYVAVVTGANKGIGFEIVRLLSTQGVTTVVAARDETRGREAVQKLRSDPACVGTLQFQQLDVTDGASIDRFASWLAATHGTATCLINNAGFAYKGSTFGGDEAQHTLDVNYFGTMAVCERLKDLIKAPGGRIINISSSAGFLSNIPGVDLRRALAHSTSVAQLTELARDFVSSVRAGTHRQRGWSNSMYGVSKSLESMYTRVLAEEQRARGVSVNAVHPGYCATDMTSWRGVLPASAGADTPVWLALLPPQAAEQITGGLYADRRRLEW